MAIIDFRKRACGANERMSKITAIAFSPSATAKYLSSLDLDSWEITSFNSQTRVVCITLITAGGLRDITVTLVQPIAKATD